MDKNLKSNYATQSYTDQRYVKKIKVEFPVLTKRDKVILFLYARYLGYKIHIGVFDGKRKALIIDGNDHPAFIQKHKETILIKYKDRTEKMNPQTVILGLMARYKEEFPIELKKAFNYAASCSI